VTEKSIISETIGDGDVATNAFTWKCSNSITSILHKTCSNLVFSRGGL